MSRTEDKSWLGRDCQVTVQRAGNKAGVIPIRRAVPQSKSTQRQQQVKNVEDVET